MIKLVILTFIPESVIAIHKNSFYKKAKNHTKKRGKITENKVRESL